jgi:hypothetical protein
LVYSIVNSMGRGVGVRVGVNVGIGVGVLVGVEVGVGVGVDMIPLQPNKAKANPISIKRPGNHGCAEKRGFCQFLSNVNPPDLETRLVFL